MSRPAPVTLMQIITTKDKELKYNYYGLNKSLVPLECSHHYLLLLLLPTEGYIP